MTTVSIVGTAGRSFDARLTSVLYEKMLNATDTVMRSVFGLNPSEVTLVSGGAAWADHVAVDLYKQGRVRGLHLHLPCTIILVGDAGVFFDNGRPKWYENPGRSCNKYHEQFSHVTKRNSIREILDVVNRGARVQIHQGFHARNTMVAQSNYLIAMTFGEGAPVNGGTSDTWNKFTGVRCHVDLGRL